MTNRLALPFLALAAVASLAACSTVASSAPAQPAASAQATAAAVAQPANPVPILKRTGAPTSAVYGEYDIEGDRYASGQFPGGEGVDVYTYADQAAMDAGSARNNGFAPSDSNVWIAGHLFTVEVTAVIGGPGTATGIFWAVSPQVIAQRVGGTVVTQQGQTAAATPSAAAATPVPSPTDIQARALAVVDRWICRLHAQGATPSQIFTAIYTAPESAAQVRQIISDALARC